jgi:4-coumarate--CoA ligase
MSELVKRTAAGLVALGLKPKDVVLLLSPNNPDFAVVYLAVVSIGAVIAPCNPLNTEADIAKQLVQASAKFVVTVPELLSKFGENIDALPTILIGKNKFSKFRVEFTVHESSDCDRCVAIPADSNNFGAAGISMTKSSESAGDKAAAGEVKRTRSSILVLSEILVDGESEYSEAAQVECHPDDTCTLLFSSGTTGLSKAVQITHRNFMSAVTAYNTLEPGASTSEDDVCLAIVPLYHVYGLGIVFLATLQRGAAVVTMARYSLPAMLQYVERFRITVATLVPPIYVVLVKSAELVAKHDLSSLRVLATGAAPLREDTMVAIQAMFPHCLIRQGYGMTESPLISFSVLANERQQWGSVGPLVPGTEARIAHSLTSASLPAMATGEVWIRGPQIMKGSKQPPTHPPLISLLSG